MRVLITGATGLIGSVLVRALVAGGHEPVALSRHPASALHVLPQLANAYRWSPTEEIPSAEAFVGVGAVVNLVGARIAGRWTPAKKADVYDTRVLSTRNLVDTMGQLVELPSVLVSASAVGYYGHRGDAELTETDGQERVSRRTCARTGRRRRPEPRP